MRIILKFVSSLVNRYSFRQIDSSPKERVRFGSSDDFYSQFFSFLTSGVQPRDERIGGESDLYDQMRKGLPDSDAAEGTLFK